MMQYITTLLALLLAGCAVADINEPGGCARYGVREDGFRLTLGQVYELPQAELNQACRFWMPPGYQKAGCYRLNPDGTADVFYRAGDPHALAHELCHVRHGGNHTAQYNRDARNGHPCPYCPIRG